MPHSAEISRASPPALICLLAQSGSTLAPLGAQRDQRKADGIRAFFHVGLNSSGGRVESACAGAVGRQVSKE
jgi:hypothetical protein